MAKPSRLTHRFRASLTRMFASAVLVCAIVVPTWSPVLADTTTGVISGVLTSAKTNGPVIGASVAIASPSASRTGTTDARGFFSFTGVTPDTYTVTVKATGFEEVVFRGVTVNAQQTTTVSQALQDRLRTIGRITARSQTGAFQPTQTTDTYTVNTAAINTILGNAYNTNESSLIAALPGASFDKSGYPVLRGGRENEEGFQFDGIDYTDAFTSQFVNSLNLNGQSSFQLTPGAGDAATGNAGTGAINIIVKRGSRPPFGTLDLEAGAPAFAHQLGFEYGFATPNGRFSDFASFIGSRNENLVGYRTTDLVGVGQPTPFLYTTSDDFVNNFVYRFGKDNSQSLQFLYQNQNVDFFSRSAPGTNFSFRSGDPVAAQYYGQFTGLGPASIGSIYGFAPYQTSQNQTLASAHRSPGQQVQPNATFKFQYSNNLDSSTFLTAKFYRVNAVIAFDYPYNFNQSGAAVGGDFSSLQGGQRTGGSLDITRQLNSKNLLTAGFKYEFLHPVFNEPSASLGFAANVFQAFAGGTGPYDFLPATNADCVALGATCGYLSQYFPNGIPRVPLYNQTTIINRQDTSVFLTDAFTPTNKLKIDAGIRVDGSNFSYPSVNGGAYLPAGGGGYSSGYYLPTVTGVDAAGNPDPTKDVYNLGGNTARKPMIVEPRLAFSYQLRPTDSIRFAYGRSVQFAPITDIDRLVDRQNYSQFAGIPANAVICGPTGDRKCRDYADQQYWTNQNIISGVPITPAKPATFSNVEASYSHDFGKGTSVKLTPFYRRGFDGLALVATPRVDGKGQPVLNPDGSSQFNAAVTTNLGVTKTTGVEFYLTKEAAYGFSGALSMTYINEFSNVIPGSVSEDFFPSIPTQSLALGNLYRVGFLSPFNANLAVSYKTRSGWKFNPTVNYNRGYPYGVGTLTSAYVNNVAVNLPNTNVTSPIGANQATQYVDPQNPGSVFNPNIAARRGTPEGASAGGYLTAPSAKINFDIEYAANKAQTFGLQVFNVFNNIYNTPSLNSRYQPVATGLAGPKTGTTSQLPLNGSALGFANYSDARFGRSAYRIDPINTPISYQFYYQLHL